MVDKYFLPKNYKINNTPTHYIDIDETDKYQKEVYLYSKKIMIEKKLKSIIDVGCGSGFKLMNYLGEFDTIGIETEPCISFLRNKYPSHKWLDSGNPENSFKYVDLSSDLVICSDVIEHIIDPNELIKFLLSINTKYYIISTPCRERLVQYHGRKSLEKPINNAHVREWTMNEFKNYLSLNFNIIESFYGVSQNECQYHLVSKKIL
jgi:2-polyprenyl-3-methyl-5-hydroxy-6-metoxy-1,4-benzoquinol methylase